jgi:ankyrin repeat protein
MNELRLIEEIKAENVASIKELIEAGADVNCQDEQGWTPLNWAAGKGDLEMVKLLVSRGADVFKVGRDQRTPYLIALAAGHVEVVKFLRQAEDKAGGEKSARPERKYCKAYYLRDLRQFPNWVESKINWKDEKSQPSENGERKPQPGSDQDIAFLHQDYTVTQSMWHGENVIFNQVTTEWKEFCAGALRFKVPDDLDLIVAR